MLEAKTTVSMDATEYKQRTESIVAVYASLVSKRALFAVMWLGVTARRSQLERLLTVQFDTKTKL